MAMTMPANPSSTRTARRGTARQAKAAKAVFLDKDGTLVHDVPYNIDPTLLLFTPHALEGLRLLSDAGYRIVIVSNQSGIALRRFDRAALRTLQVALTDLLADAGVPLHGFYICPHAPATLGQAAACGCRKPAPGLLHQAAAALRLDLAASWMVGDILDDVEAGHRAGCRSVLLDVGNETVWAMSAMRTPDARVGNLLEAAQHILGRKHGSRSTPDAGAAQWTT